MGAIHASFQELSDTDFETYTTALLDTHQDATQRQRHVAYLQSVNSADYTSLETDRKTLAQKRQANKRKQVHIDSLLTTHSFDFSRDSALLHNVQAVSASYPIFPR